MTDTQETFGVFLADGAGKPAAIIADGDQAVAVLRSLDPARTGIVAPANDLTETNDDVKALFESRAVAVPAPTNAANEILAGEVRTNQRRELLAEEIRNESKTEARQSAKAEAKDLAEAMEPSAEEQKSAAEQRRTATTGRR